MFLCFMKTFRKTNRYYKDMITLFIADIALVAPFIPTDTEECAANA